jgi:hypothetical protein
MEVDVWFLRPQCRKPGETATEFSSRVKAMISKQAKLKNVSWDGYLKNVGISKTKIDKLRADPQMRFGSIILDRLKRKYASEERQHFLKRSQSVSNMANSVLEWTPGTESSLEIQNDLIKQLRPEAPSSLYDKINAEKDNVAATWRKYTQQGKTKLRMENLCWRLWFKQNLNFKKEEHELRRKKPPSNLLMYEDTRRSGFLYWTLWFERHENFEAKLLSSAQPREGLSPNTTTPISPFIRHRTIETKRRNSFMVEKRMCQDDNSSTFLRHGGLVQSPEESTEPFGSYLQSSRPSRLSSSIAVR